MTNRPDVSSAAETETLALATTLDSKPVLNKSKVAQKTIAVRINEIDYNRLNSLFVAQGTNLSAAGRAAIFFLAEQIEAGKLTIPNGVIYRETNTNK